MYSIFASLNTAEGTMYIVSFSLNSMTVTTYNAMDYYYGKEGTSNRDVDLWKGVEVIKYKMNVAKVFLFFYFFISSLK